MSKKRLPVSVDCSHVVGMSVQNYYAEYDSEKKEIKGSGRGWSHHYADLPFEPTFDAVLYDKQGRIHSTVMVSYNGVFRQTGQMHFTFKFSGVESMEAGRIKLALIAKPK